MQQIIRASTEIQYQLGDKIILPPKKIPGENKVILIAMFFQEVYKDLSLHHSLNSFNNFWKITIVIDFWLCLCLFVCFFVLLLVLYNP